MATDVARGLTDQQRRAVIARGVSVALSAGAGCGKTFVLTERFLAELVPDGPSAIAEANVSPAREAAADPRAQSRSAPDRAPQAAAEGAARPRLAELVAITFTERAAREMRDRIRAACRRRVLEAPDDQVEYWLNLIREMDSARISTIHSFCGTLLRSHAVEAGLDPQFQVLEQAQADTLSYELVDDELRHRLIARDEAVIDLVFRFGLESLRGMVATLLGRRDLIDWPQWREVTPDELVARWEGFSREVAGPRRAETIARSEAAQAVLRIAREQSPRHPTMADRCRVLVERMSRLPESTDLAADLEAILEAARVEGGGGKRAWPSAQVYARFRDAARKLRDEVKSAAADLAIDAPAARPAAEAGLRLLSVAESVEDAYESRKRELAALDFNDLLIHAQRLLTGPEGRELRRRLASQIRLLLVDEFQDTDRVQVELVKALCGPMLKLGKLFFVGDYKQSIYRFRGADPHVFRQLRGEIPAGGRLPLTLNFRSQPAILHFVNALFREAMGPDYEPLVAHRPQVAPEPAVELLWAPDESPQERSGQMARLRRREADWIARRLRAMLDRGERIVWDDEAAERGAPGTRAVRPGDVALLFRALSDVQYYEEALRRYEIPYYLVGGHAFYAQQEIYDLLNLLRSLASRCDEVSLVGVLRSPMFALEDETLFWLAEQPGRLSGGLFAETPPAELSDEQRRRVEFARDTLIDLRSIKDRVPIAELVDEALSRTGYDAVLLAEFLGERKLANLRKLVDQARGFDRAGIFSLSDFITQLSEFVARQPDEPLAATHPEASDVVRLMTIHQSKGLEFPVVVVPDLDRRAQPSTASVAFTPDLGPLVKTPEGGGFALHAAMEQEEDQAERIRLLYVATTRAADYLILSGGVPEIGAARGPWTQLLGRRFDPATGRLRAPLAPGDPEPKIQVTLSEPPLAAKPSPGPPRPSPTKLADRAVRMAKRAAARVPELLGPVPVDRGARRQYSFSRLTGKLHAQPAGAASPEPRETEEASALGPPLDPLGLGTLVHEVLAQIELGRPDDAVLLVRCFAPRHLPDADGPDGLEEPIEMVRRFLASPRAAEMAASPEVHRELEFLLAWPPGGEEPEPRYLQGFVDCLYQDAAGRWVVLDYKTSHVTASSLGTAAGEYEMQMLLYGLAVERILGAPPADLVLYFLRPGLEHHFAWDGAARVRVEELVNRSLAGCVEP
jgi:ATP-dependent helicase/nuclease subunit A